MWFSSYNLFEGANIHYIVHRYVNSYWYFALDHYNHARWLSVHIYDLLALPQNTLQLDKFFKDGYFTFL